MALLNSQFPPALQAEILAIVNDGLRDGDLSSVSGDGGGVTVSAGQYVLKNPTSSAAHGTVTGAGAVTADTGTTPSTTTDIEQSNFIRICSAAYDLINTGRAENVLFSTLVKRMQSATV